MAYQFERITILVVEDSQPMMEITRALLSIFGVANIIAAPNGDIGFRYMCEFNPDIVIVDWMMKPVNGIEFTKKIRTNPQCPNPFVPIILMTGFSEKHRVLTARDAGVTEFLVKPFTARELYRRIVQIIERPRQFVKAHSFFGPDRRRKIVAEQYNGPLRREKDRIDASMNLLVNDRKAVAQEHFRRAYARQDQAMALEAEKEMDIMFGDSES